MANNKGSNYLLDSRFLLNKTRIQEGNKIADLGCGASGHFVFPASRIVGKNGQVYAVDVLKHALEVIQKKADQENFNNTKEVWSNLEIFKGTKIEAESLDVALLINTLFQSPNKAAILREAVRLLKKSGHLLIVEWENSDSPLGPPTESRVKKEPLKSAAQKLGLKLEEEFNAGDYHYGMLFTKM